MEKRWFGILVTLPLLSGGSFALAADYVPPATAVSKINSYRGYSELTSAASGMDIDQYT